MGLQQQHSGLQQRTSGPSCLSGIQREGSMTKFGNNSMRRTASAQPTLPNSVRTANGPAQCTFSGNTSGFSQHAPMPPAKLPCLLHTGAGGGSAIAVPAIVFCFIQSTHTVAPCGCCCCCCCSQLVYAKDARMALPRFALCFQPCYSRSFTTFTVGLGQACIVCAAQCCLPKLSKLPHTSGCTLQGPGPGMQFLFLPFQLTSSIMNCS